MNKKSLVIFLSSLFLHTILNAQEWTLKLRSSVELRTFKLTNKVDISKEKLAGLHFLKMPSLLHKYKAMEVVIL